MGEIVYDVPGTVPALPSADTSFPMPPIYSLWFTHAASRAGIVLALVPPALLGAFVLLVIAVDVAESVLLAMLVIVALYGIFLSLLLCLATLGARRAERRHVREAALLVLPRLQSAKDWFIRGDISEGEFEQFKALVETSVEGKTPDVAAQTTGNTIRAFVLMLTVAAGLLVPFNLIILFELLYTGDMEGFVVFLGIAAIDAVTVLLVLTGWRTVGRAKIAAVSLRADATKRIDALERELLTGAKGRRGAPSGASRPTPGPSFRAYGR